MCTEQQPATTNLSKTVNFSNYAPSRPIVSSTQLGWHGIVVEQYYHPPGEIGTQSYSEHIVCLCLARPLHVLQVKNDRVQEGTHRKGEISITPAGIPTAERWDGDDHYLHLRLEPGFIQRVAAQAIEMNPDRVELLTNFCIQDQHIEHIGMLLLAELKSGGLAVRLYAESLANVLAVQLLRKYSSSAPATREYTGGLPRYKLQRAIEYIHDNLEIDLKLAEIAEVVGMSPYYFAKQLKQEIGLAPHQYLVEVRIERAKQLLTDTKLPIVEVCHQVGFHSQSYFSTLFRKHVGVTPKTYRQEA